MIGKAKSISHGVIAIDYASKKKEAIEIGRQFVIGTKGIDVLREFHTVNPNHNLKNDTISIVLSPHPKSTIDKKEDFFKKILNEYVNEMKFTDHQYVAYVHKDVPDRPHIHLYVNRCNINGDVYNDSFISKKSQRVSDLLAEKHGLIRAKEVQERNDTYKDILKDKIKATHQEILKAKPTKLDTYIELMASEDIQVKKVKNKQNEIQGLKIEYQGFSFKASEVDRKMSIKNLETSFKQNQTEKTWQMKDTTFKL
jgi:hypothetical protein